MKNFPHQVNDIDKIRLALQVASDIISKGEDFGDDEVYGKELVWNEVHTYTDELTIPQYLEREARKETKNQGFRTAAREHRRFFILIEFINQIDNSYKITKSGLKLLSSSRRRQIDRIWHDSLMSLELPDSKGNISNPYKLMVKLILRNPGIEIKKLCLPFVCINNSDSEFEKIQKLVELEYDEIVTKLKLNIHTAKNVRYVLPAIGEQIGDFIREKTKIYPSELLKDSHQNAIQYSEDFFDTEIPLRSARIVDSNEIAKIPVMNDECRKSILTDFANGIEMTYNRLVIHQKLVKNFASFLEGNGYSLCEDPFDCFAEKSKSKLLIEAKTILEEFKDQRYQSQRAIGQIRGYKYFYLAKYRNSEPVKLIVLYDREPMQKITDFMVENCINPIWQSEVDNNFKIYLNGKVENLTVHNLSMLI